MERTSGSEIHGEWARACACWWCTHKGSPQRGGHTAPLMKTRVAPSVVLASATRLGDEDAGCNDIHRHGGVVLLRRRGEWARACSVGATHNCVRRGAASRPHA